MRLQTTGPLNFSGRERMTEMVKWIRAQFAEWVKVQKAEKGNLMAEGTALWQGHSRYLLSLEMIAPLHNACVPAAVQWRKTEEARCRWTSNASQSVIWNQLFGQCGRGTLGCHLRGALTDSAAGFGQPLKIGWIGTLKGNILVQAWQMNAYANSLQACHFYAKRTQMVFTITLRGKC